MADIEQTTSKRDLLKSRMKEIYPDVNLDDEEALNGQILDHFDQNDQTLAGYKQREKELTDLFAKDPRSAHFFTSMAKGKDPLENLVEFIGIDGIKEMLEDPANIEKYAERNKEFLQRVAKEKELKEQWEQNIIQTLQMLEEKKETEGLSNEQVDAAADWIRDVMNDGVLGIIKPETIDMALKAINHDNDVEAAQVEGEVRGKNAKIEEKLRRASKGDGLPDLGGQGSTHNTPERDLGALGSYDSKDIWDRGGMKRIRRR